MTAQTLSNAPDDAPPGSIRTFPCPACGGDLTFDIRAQNLKCPFCQHEQALEPISDATVDEQDLQRALARISARRCADAKQGRAQPGGGAAGDLGYEVNCDACGGTLVFEQSVTSTDCGYCGTPIQRDAVHTAPDRITVDGVLGFRIDRDAARGALREWVSSRWFAPNEFKRRGISGRFQGIYMPYWTYDAATATRYEGQRGEHYTVEVGEGENRRRVRRTHWYPASGSFRRFFDDVLVSATRAMKRKLADSLLPWPLDACQPFDPALLAGYQAMTYDIELGDGFAIAKQRMQAAIEAEVRQRIGGDAQRIESIRIQFGALTYKHLLLPVWMLAYRYHDKSYQVVVNACSGEVQGERPYSWIKITAAALLGAAVIAVGLSLSGQF